MDLRRFRSISYEVGLTINSKLIRNAIFIQPEKVPHLLREAYEFKQYKVQYYRPRPLFMNGPIGYDSVRAINMEREEIWTIHLTHAMTLRYHLSDIEQIMEFVRPFDPTEYHLIGAGDYYRDTFEYGHLREDVKILPTLIYGMD